MRIRTNYVALCGACEAEVRMFENNKGHLQFFCRRCGTSVFINRPSTLDLMLLKGRAREAVEVKDFKPKTLQELKLKAAVA